jgi:hypothetical protein
MAIGRISGQMLKANLARSGTDLAFETNLLALDVTNSRVGVGTASPAVTFHVSATDSVRLASGTTAQRPGSPANGDIRYNSTLTTIEGYSNGAWANMASGDELKDADNNTKIQVEESADENIIRFDIEGSEKGKIDATNTTWGVNQFTNAASTWTGTATDGAITITPNGSGAVVISSAMTIAGNLTVSGTTTTVSTTNTVIADNILELNNGISASTNDAGIIIERGSTGNNACAIWDESADAWVFGTTTATGADKSGGLTIAGGEIQAATGTFTNVDGILGANTAAAATTTTLTSTGNVSLNGGTFIFNEASADLDFRCESNGEANMFFIDGGNDRIGIGTATPSYELDIGSSTDAVLLPNGTTGQRPTAATGIIRFNTSTGKYEGCQDGSTFISFAVAGDTPTISKVSATGDGSTTAFTSFFSSAPQAVSNVLVFIDNVYQEPTENYTISTTTITFTSAPHTAARIFAIAGFDNTALASSGVARTEATSVSVTSSATTVFSYNASTYRSAEVFLQFTDAGNSEYSCMKCNVTHDGAVAYGNVYGVVNSAAETTDEVVVTFLYDSAVVYVKAAVTGGAVTGVAQYSLCAV